MCVKVGKQNCGSLDECRSVEEGETMVDFHQCGQSGQEEDIQDFLFNIWKSALVLNNSRIQPSLEIFCPTLINILVLTHDIAWTIIGFLSFLDWQHIIRAA